MKIKFTGPSTPLQGRTNPANALLARAKTEPRALSQTEIEERAARIRERKEKRLAVARARFASRGSDSVTRLTNEIRAVMVLERQRERAVEEGRSRSGEEDARMEALKAEAIQFFIDRPGAKSKEFPSRVWVAIYRHKLFPGGLNQVRELAEEARGKR